MTTRRQFMMSVPAAAAAFALADNFVLDASPARAQQIDPLQGHFHPKRQSTVKVHAGGIENRLRRLCRSPTKEISRSRRRGSLLQ